jgi:hypothetical protein
MYVCMRSYVYMYKILCMYVSVCLKYYYYVCIRSYVCLGMCVCEKHYVVCMYVCMYNKVWVCMHVHAYSHRKDVQLLKYKNNI